MRSNFFDRLTSIRFYLVLTFVVVVVTPTRVFSNKMKEDRSEARVIGDLPRLDITTYLNIAMEPHNAMVQVCQKQLRHSHCPMVGLIVFKFEGTSSNLAHAKLKNKLTCSF